MSRVRRPAVAGLFYPAQSAPLLAAVESLFAEAAGPAAPARAAVLPHAGYVYSGRTAARTLARIAVPRTVVVVAPNHTGEGHAAQGGSAWAVGTWRTPMGDVPVDELLAADLLARCPALEDDPAAHVREHAVEVLVPLLLARRPDVAIVPVVLAFADWPHCRALGEALAALAAGRAEPPLLVASSDLNHYESAAVGGPKDRMAMDAMIQLDGEALLQAARRHRISMCGRAPAAAVLHAARLLGAATGELVDYSHSGMVTGDDASVVGYAGIVVR